jgi:hypothetical protein
MDGSPYATSCTWYHLLSSAGTVFVPAPLMAKKMQMLEEEVSCVHCGLQSCIHV